MKRIKYTAASGCIEVDGGVTFMPVVRVAFPRQLDQPSLTMTVDEAEELSVVLTAIVADLRDKVATG